MRATLTALLAGLVFGIGLVISGMSNPAKVLNFLDIAGNWDPSLAFVMAGAVFVTSIGYRLILRRQAPEFASAFALPTRRDIDMPLIAGAAIFGLGWGLGGFCPGPAWTALPAGDIGTLAFFPAMIAGMWIAKTALAQGHALRTN
jgi:uncharacterized membrane protein YedE/YeeE